MMNLSVNLNAGGWDSTNHLAAPTPQGYNLSVLQSSFFSLNVTTPRRPNLYLDLSSDSDDSENVEIPVINLPVLDDADPLGESTTEAPSPEQTLTEEEEEYKNMLKFRKRRTRSAEPDNKRLGNRKFVHIKHAARARKKSTDVMLQCLRQKRKQSSPFHFTFCRADLASVRQDKTTQSNTSQNQPSIPRRVHSHTMPC